MSLDLTGIHNVGEFYSHHYLDALLEGDLKPIFKRWRTLEQEKVRRAPHKTLDSLANRYFAARARADELPADDTAGRWQLARDLNARLLEALGYARQPGSVLLDDGSVLPVCHAVDRSSQPYLWVFETGFAPHAAGDQDPDPLAQPPVAEQLSGDDAAEQRLADGSWRELLDRVVFRQEAAPRWVLVLAGSEVWLCDRRKWGQGRALRFDLETLFARRQAAAFQAVAGLLHIEVLCPEGAASLHDTLDENSHKHAYAVSTDLRYGAQQAIELLGRSKIGCDPFGSASCEAGNGESYGCAARQRRQQVGLFFISHVTLPPLVPINAGGAHLHLTT